MGYEWDRDQTPLYVGLGFYMFAQICIAIFAFLRKSKQTRQRADQRMPGYGVGTVRDAGKNTAEPTEFGKRNSYTEQDADYNSAVSSDVEYMEHFAGGKTFGPVVIFLTFFSTAYSGYTISGIPQESSALGFFSMWWMTAYNVMNTTSLIWKPRLRRLSGARKWIAYEDPINDRYNNRLLTMMYICCGCGGQIVYVIVQMYSMNKLMQVILPNIEDDLGLTPKGLTWIMAGLMLFAEVLGGFGAVVFTDSIQSVIMITAMTMVPLIATVHFGGAAASVEKNCGNYEVLNCSEGTLLYERKAKCKGKSAQPNGCLVYTNGWNTVHPTVNAFSEYFAPIYKTEGNNLPWPTFPCDAQGNYNTSFDTQCQNPGKIQDISKATRGIDGAWIFNYQNWIYAQLAFQFGTNVAFMPNFVARFYTAKDDLTLKKSAIVQVMIGGLIATLPAVLSGIMAGANLANKFPSGSSAFGMIVADFNNRGGFEQVVAIMASTGAVAAFMSTADSSIISITTMMTTEFIQNGLFKAFPAFDKPIVMKVFAICCSTTVIFTATIVALEDAEINDPKSNAYSHMGTWQTLFFGFCTIPTVCAIFIPKASDWACLAGMFAGWICYFVINEGLKWGTNVGTSYYTPFADEPKHILLRGYLWCFVADALVTVPLCFVDLKSMMPTPKFLQINTRRYDKDGEPLSWDAIKTIMVGTREVWQDKIGIAIMVIAMIIVFFQIPSWGKSHNGCNISSFGKWLNDGEKVDGCEGPILCGGIPCWAMGVFITFAVNKALISIAYTRWKTIDEAYERFPWGPYKSETKDFRASRTEGMPGEEPSSEEPAPPKVTEEGKKADDSGAPQQEMNV